MPVIIRVDGKAFHTWTRGMAKPFDHTLMGWINLVAIDLCKEVSGAAIAYVQSDEISLLVHGYRRFGSQPWLANRVQKMASIAAARASATMTYVSGRAAMFDARVFILPEADVVNYFVWRQQDWTRNSIQMLARSIYSHAACRGKNQSQLQDMIHETGANWNDLAPDLKRGRCVLRRPDPTIPERTHWAVDDKPPIFTQDRGYIEQHLALVEGGPDHA
jgi:tRNA(His) 5'-end guanylyltransferase